MQLFFLSFQELFIILDAGLKGGGVQSVILGGEEYLIVSVEYLGHSFMLEDLAKYRFVRNEENYNGNRQS